MKLTEARDKDLILIYLKKYQSNAVNILTIRNELFGQSFSFKKVRQYANELSSNGYVLPNKNNASEINYLQQSDIFIESGGFIKLLFAETKIPFNDREMLEAHHKDLILYWLKPESSSALWRPDGVKMDIFQNLELSVIRYYIDILRNDEYIWVTPSDAYCFRYYKNADKFLENGGYTGKYYLELYENAELEAGMELNISKRRKLVSDRKEYIEYLKTTGIYVLLRYGIWVLVPLITLLIILTLFGIVPKDQAIKGFKWLWSLVF